MCFEYISPSDREAMNRHFELEAEAYLAKFELELFPKRSAPVILPNRKLEVMQWGFQHPTLKKPVFNARSETVAKNPMFRGAFKSQRCLLPASGFCEKDKERRKYLITLPEPIFAFAGLFRRDGQVTMLTCAPNPFMEKIHNRMPVILHKRDYDQWFTEGGTDLLVPYIGEMAARVVAEPKPPKLPKPPKMPKHQQGELF